MSFKALLTEEGPEEYAAANKEYGRDVQNDRLLARFFDIG